ncbi:MAG: hypothetical protein WAS33_02285 [Candidatus Promineifilaceae bacterium]
MAKREYIAYLLRLWREKQDGSWRALLENPTNGERNGFATLAELVTFLEDKTGEKIQVAFAIEESAPPKSQNSIE